MNTHDQIIALLQGDFKDDARVAALMGELASSAEHRRLLLEHIQLNQEVEQFIGGIAPLASTKAALWNRIDAFDRTHGGNGDDKSEAADAHSSRFSHFVWGGIVLSLLAGFGLGYWFSEGRLEVTSRDSVPIVNPHVAPSDKTSTAPSIPAPAGDHQELSAPVSNVASSPIIQGESPRQRVLSPLAPQANGASSADIIPPPERVQVLVPNGGEQFTLGSRVPVRWNGIPPNTPVVIECSTDGGRSWIEVDQKGQNGSALWAIPPTLPPATQCLMRVAVKDTARLEPSFVREFRGHDSGAAVAEISPDGKWLATVGSDTKVLLWNLQTGELVHSMAGHTGYVTFAKFNRDGTRFASCSQDGTVRVWNIPEGTEAFVLTAEGFEKKVPWTVAFSPDGGTIATSNDDGTISLWNGQSGVKLNSFTGMDGTFKPHKAGIRYLEYTADGSKMIASSGDLSATVFDAKTGQVYQKFLHHVDDSLAEDATREQIREAWRRRIVNGIQITPDGKIAITCGYNGLVKFWNVDSGILIRSREYHGGAKVSSITISPDGKQIASVGYDGTTKIIDVATGDVLGTIAIDGPDSAVPMTRASFSPDGEFVAIAHWDGKATLWRLHPLINVDISDSFWSIEPCKDVELK